MSRHVPILTAPITEALVEALAGALRGGQREAWFVDCTLGGGGHTGILLERIQSDPSLKGARVLGIDRDETALTRARERFAREIGEGLLELRHDSFADVASEVSARPVYALLADLGFSSDQVDDPVRGLSFISDGPLDMRLDASQGPTCRDLLARITERELESILSEYGEERYSRRIAQAILSTRRGSGLPRTTLELASLIERAVPPTARHGRIHAATRSFQALRIAVNGEMDALDSLLGRVILGVRVGGRVAILSFHSLEDRRVKLAFKGEGFKSLSKKPIEADEEEVRRNPRSRSAKLRVAERVG